MLLSFTLILALVAMSASATRPAVELASPTDSSHPADEVNQDGGRQVSFVLVGDSTTNNGTTVNCKSLGRSIHVGKNGDKSWSWMS